MKIRNGFVSNSSSSSFVVCIPDEIDFEKCAVDTLTRAGWTKQEVIQADLDWDTFVDYIKSIYDRGSWWQYRYPGSEILQNFDFDINYKDIFGGKTIAGFDAGPDDSEVRYIKKSELLSILKEL